MSREAVSGGRDVISDKLRRFSIEYAYSFPLDREISDNIKHANSILALVVNCELETVGSTVLTDNVQMTGRSSLGCSQYRLNNVH